MGPTVAYGGQTHKNPESVVYVTTTAGTNPRLVANPGSNPDFIGSSGFIVYSNGGGISGTELLVVDAATPGARPVAITPPDAPRFVAGPKASDAGDVIAFHGRAEAGANRDVYVLRAGEAQAENITPNTPDTEEIPTDVSPDGSLVAYTSLVPPIEPNTPSEVFVSRADGSGVVDISKNPQTADADGRFSPDGSRLAWFSSPLHASCSGQVLTADLAGANRTVEESPVCGFEAWARVTLLPTPPQCDHGYPDVAGTDAGERLELDGYFEAGHTVIVGLGGDDRIVGSGPGNALCGGGGDDRITGGYRIFGQAGDDVIDASGRGDKKDRLYGGPGSDVLIGSAGDEYRGGPGQDRCGPRKRRLRPC